VDRGRSGWIRNDGADLVEEVASHRCPCYPGGRAKLGCVKVFLSSVRRGLEDERRALPGLIQALGHEPLAFEGFTARDVPSRQACLDGVEQADAYLLLLGEHYGDVLPETGKAPTEEEFAVARRRGIPILVFRKRGVVMEPAQEAFGRRVEAYATGEFRKAFETTADLLTEVAAALRDVERVPSALTSTALTAAVDVPWGRFADHTWRSTAAILELAAVPIPAARPSATTLDSAPGRLSRLGRDHGIFTDEQALDTGLVKGGAHASARPDRSVAIGGIGLTDRGDVLVWRELPSDGLGVILDPADLSPRIAAMVRLVAELVPKSGSVALTVGLHGLGSVMEGRIDDLGHRTQASFPGFGYDKDALVEPRDSVPAASLISGGNEIGQELAVRLLHRFREVVR
jgi:hypothetical protein